MFSAVMLNGGEVSAFLQSVKAIGLEESLIVVILQNIQADIRQN